MTGPERRDESVAFSLKELMKLEDERVDEERAALLAAERRAASERAARDEAERQARIIAEEERARSLAKEREEEARLEAMQRATVEQARITVEARTRADESERERAHERELTRMRLEATKRPGPALYIGSAMGGAGLALAAFLVFFFAIAKPDSDRRIRELQGSVDAERDRAAGLDVRLGSESAKLQITQRELEAARRQLAAVPVAPAVATAPKPPVVHGGGVVPKLPVGPKDDKPCVDPHDPLCFHIP